MVTGEQQAEAQGVATAPTVYGIETKKPFAVGERLYF